MRSKQVAQGFIHLGLENPQELRLYNILGQSGPLPDYLCGEKVFPYIKSELPLFDFMSAISCPTVMHHLAACSQ